MLHTLRIRNYALIDDLEVEFRPGFNVLTGETGAGKSIVVGALNLVLGARASADTVRAGAMQAKVDALFRLPSMSERLAALLEEHAVELDGDELLLSRVVSAEGRSRAYAGGNLIPAGVLAEIGDELVDLHGQHEHQSLLRVDRQLDLLDAYADCDNALTAVAAAVRAFRDVDKELKRLESDDREQARRVDFMRFEAEEIGKAGLTPGEETELRERRTLIMNAEKIASLASGAYAALYESDSGTAAVDTLGTAARNVEELVQVDARFIELATRLQALQNETEAAAEELRGYTEEIDYSPEEFDALNTRLTLIRTLQKKYGATVEEILAYRERALGEIDAYDSRDERLATLRKDRDLLHAAAMDTAQALSKKRRKAADALAKRVAAALQDLGMKGARFEVRFDAAELGANGIDRIEFLLQANAGEKAKPLRQVASGGEISRIMLALKATFADADRIPTLIFDEIDAGIGGAVAAHVADRIAALAKSHQVVCITHLPQIAAAANAHYHVEKAAAKGKTTTRVVAVEGGERVREVARLLDGAQTELSEAHARELLERRAS